MATIETTTGNFADIVIGSPIPVLVDFWATWCGPCLAIAPALEEIAAANTGTITVAKVNIDDHPELAREHQIMSIPTLLLYSEGQVVKTIVGARHKSQLLAELSPYLGKDAAR